MMKTTITAIVLVQCYMILGASAQETLEQRIETVFGTATNNSFALDTSTQTVGFDVIVQPDPIVEPTTAPQILTTGGGEMCTCVPYYLCDPGSGTIRTDGQRDGFGIIDIRFNPNSCQDILDVCCVESQRREEPVQPTSSSTMAAPAQPEPPKGCGIRNVGGLDFQLAGNTNEAGFGEFPWTVALIQISDDSCICGGSLIHPQVILTANHCVRLMPSSSIKIRAGEWDTQTTKERLPYQERTVSQMVSHPNFNSKTLANDIALLVVDTPFTLDEHINTVCLPKPGQVAVGTTCAASGWGKDVFGKAGKYSVIQKRVELPLVNSTVCEKKLQNTRLGPRFRLDSSFICAGGEPGVDTCQGDGGAPLACPIGSDNRYVQSGIVSWGIGCKESHPAVYVDVADFRNWVDTLLTDMGFGIASYTAPNRN